jgi:hypothetical protein
MTQPFAYPREADALANTQDLEACRRSTLPYGDFVRTLQIDMVAFDNADSSIRACEIKRGNGQFDAGKIRSITRDLKCIQVLLKSYGELCKYKPAAAESKIIFYYGVRSIPRPWSLVKNELDEHFGFPVVEKIEQANDYFRDKLHALCARLKLAVRIIGMQFHQQRARVGIDGAGRGGDRRVEGLVRILRQMELGL